MLTRKMMRSVLVKKSFGIASLYLSMAACMDLQGPDFVGADQNALLSRIEIMERAVMIRVGDSLQLNIKAISATKDTLQIDTANLELSSADPVIATVTESGMLHAKSVNPDPVRILARYKHDRVTRIDTIPVYVTAEKYDVSDARLISLDSNIVGSAGADGGGASIFGIPRIRLDLYKDGSLVVKGVRTHLEKPKQVTLAFMQDTSGAVGDYYLVDNSQGLIGKFWIKAALNLYGTNIADSVLFYGKYAAVFGSLLYELEPGVINGDFSFGTPAVFLQPCAVISFLNALPYPIDVVFDDSTASSDGCAELILDEEASAIVTKNVVGGNIYNLQPFNMGIRRSSTLGERAVYLRNSETKDSLNYVARVDVREAPID